MSSSCSNCLKLANPTQNCTENIERFVNQKNTEMERVWGRSVNPAVLDAMLRNIRKTVKCETGRAEVDRRIEELESNEKTPLSPELLESWLKKYGGIPEEFAHRVPPQFNETQRKRLLSTQAERDESLRAMGYDVPIKTMSRSELEECWRRRYGFVPEVEGE